MNKIVGLIKIHFYSLIKGKKLKIGGLKGYIGRGSRIVVENNSEVFLGEKNWVSDYCAIVSTGKGIKTGSNCYFNSNVRIFSIEKVEIGNDCLFGPNIVIVDHDHKFTDKEQPICKQGYKQLPVTIGNNVWVGANCVITKGVAIPDNVVIGAGSVVTKSIEESGVYGGNPLRKIKEI